MQDACIIMPHLRRGWTNRSLPCIHMDLKTPLRVSHIKDQVYK